jgi:hypothetical protein
VQEVFGFVKKNLSGAQRRNSAASEERGVGQEMKRREKSDAQI